MIKDADMEQPEEIEENPDKRKIEAGVVETKEHKTHTKGQEGPTQESS